MTTIAPPRTDAEKAAHAAREAARRTREWRDRCRVRAMTDAAVVQAFIDLQAARPHAGPGPAYLTLRDVVRRGKEIMVASGFAPTDATAAIASRLDPYGVLRPRDEHRPA